MKILCRIGFHSWGKYSREWIRRYLSSVYQDQDTFVVFRSLRCKHCDFKKHYEVSRLAIVRDGAYPSDPTWD